MNRPTVWKPRRFGPFVNGPYGHGIDAKSNRKEAISHVWKKFLPIGITADERVCSGAHYARLFTRIKYYLEHPEQLETPPETVKFDPGMEYHVPKPQSAEERETVRSEE